MHVDRLDGIESFLERAAWHGVDGLEVDLTELSQQEYILLKEYLQEADVPTRSLHYARTQTVALQEWKLFKSQLSMLVTRAQDLDCNILSVHPPKVEIETSHTLRDLQQFMEQVDAYADACDVQLCFALAGFMKDPQLINIAFEQLSDPSLGVLIDLDALVAGIDPLQILEKLDVQIHKVRFPMSVAQMEEYVDEMADTGAAAVAQSLT